MSQLNWRPRTRSNWTPASYTAGETDELFPVMAGEAAGLCTVRTRTVFNGSGTAAIIIIGDDGDTDRMLEDGNCDETTVGLYLGLGVSKLNGPHLYTVNNTIDVVFTANTAGTRTTGAIDVHVWIARLDPL